MWQILSAAATLLVVTASLAQGQSMMTRHTRLEVTSGQAKFVNRLPGTQILRLDIVLPLRDQAGLESFLKEVYDPASPIYRHFLTVPEFTERFGPTQEDYDAVVAFAKARGFAVVGGTRDGMDVQVEGSVTIIEAALNVSMGLYQHPTEDRTFYAPDREPNVPLGFPLWHISGLDNFSIPRPALVHRKPGEQPAATTGSGPSASFLGSDMRGAYYGGSLTGTGQNIGLLEYYGYDITDLNTYYTNARQTNLSSLVVGLSTDGTSLSCVYPSCDDTEQILDMTQALGMAPGIAKLYVYVGSTDTAILSSMTTHSPLPAQLSCSWGWSPADPGTDDLYYEKMAAQGQNFFVAAGDNDRWTKRNTPYPAEDANVVAVGGTDLSTSSAGGPWASETAWSPYSGGGISPDDIPIPSWQKLSGVINSSNDGSTTYRNGPDVAANANFTFYVCADQTTCTANEYGGTSFAAPMWAGYLALVNQQALLNHNALLGFINPLIYPIGVSSSYDSDFHDITSGSNGYPAVVGYDLVTGWGSPNGAALLNALAGTSSSPNFSLSASPGSVSVVRGKSGTSTITASISGGFNAAIALTASGQPSGVTVSFNPTSIAAPGSGTSTMTMAVASGTATGTYTITVTGTGGGLTRTTTVSLTVTAAASPDFSISASPTALTVEPERPGNVTITTAGSGGFSSSVSLSASGAPSGVTISFNPATIPAPGSGTSTMRITVSSRAAIGTYTITITGVGGGKTHTTTVSLTT
ncbi:MAG: S53 family peptidase [Terriglobia bacterium]